MAQAAKTAPSARELALVQAIRDAADVAGMSQKDVASAVGLSPSQVSRIFSGQKPITLTETLLMLGAVGLDLESVARDLGL